MTQTLPSVNCYQAAMGQRQEQIERVMGTTVGMYGDLQGIAVKDRRMRATLYWLDCRLICKPHRARSWDEYKAQ